MSIIYEALKKTQRNIDYNHNNKQPFKFKPIWIKSFLLFIATSLLSFNLYSLYFEIKSHTTVKSHKIIFVPSLPVLNKAEYISKHKLTGVFISDEETLAMINYHPYHVGDIVDGLRITSIQLDTIQLQNNQTSIVLQSA